MLSPRALIARCALLVLALILLALATGCSVAPTSPIAPDAPQLQVGPGCQLGAHVDGAAGFPGYTVYGHYPVCPAPAGAATWDVTTKNTDGTSSTTHYRVVWDSQ